MKLSGTTTQRMPADSGLGRDLAAADSHAEAGVLAQGFGHLQPYIGAGETGLLFVGKGEQAHVGGGQFQAVGGGVGQRFGQAAMTATGRPRCWAALISFSTWGLSLASLDK